MYVNIDGKEAVLLSDKEKKYLREFKETFLKSEYERAVSWHIRVDMANKGENVKTSTINYYLNNLCKMQVLQKESKKGTCVIYKPSHNYDLALKYNNIK